MKRLITVLSAALLLLLMTPLPAAAAEFRTGTNTVIGPGEVIDDDLYVAGNTIEILGTVRGDVFAAGQNIIVQGTIEGGLSAAGSSIVINGKIGRSARLAGSSISVGGQIERDLLVAGATISAGSGSRIGRDLLFGGASLAMAGEVGRDLRGNGGDIEINGRVGRNVELTDTSSVKLGDGARIAGILTYTGAKEATIATGAEVRDNRGFTPVTRERPAVNPIATTIEYLWGILRSFIGLAVLGLLLVWLLPRPIERARQTLAGAPAQSFGIGFIALLFAPPAIVILFILGLLLGTAQLPAVLTALVTVGVSVAGVIVGLEIGRLVLQATGKKDGPAWVEVLIGAAFLTALGALPLVGWIFTGISAALGFGAMLYGLIQAARLGRPTAAPDRPIAPRMEPVPGPV